MTTEIIQGVFALVATVATALIGIFVPRAITAFETRTGIQLTDQQIAQVTAAAQTAAGILQTKLDQGRIGMADVTLSNAAVVLEAQAAVARVPHAAAALDKTVSSMAETIVGLVNTTPKPPPGLSF